MMLYSKIEKNSKNKQNWALRHFCKYFKVKINIISDRILAMHQQTKIYRDGKNEEWYKIYFLLRINIQNVIESLIQNNNKFLWLYSIFIGKCMIVLEQIQRGTRSLQI